MVQKKSYSRYFIILQEDEKGYSLASDKLASGYTKLEVKNDKCKISYYVQNLKKEMAPYYMMLICNKKDVKKVIKIGEMNIDDYGRTDICYEYPVENVAGSGISVDKVSGAAIVKLLDNNIMSVMSGFATTDIPEWKAFEITEDKTREVKEPINKVEEPQSIFDKYEESIEAAKDNEIVRQDGIKQTEDIVPEEKQQSGLNENNPEDNTFVREEEQLGNSETEETNLENKVVREEVIEEKTHIEEKGHEDLNNEELFREQKKEDDISSYKRDVARDFFMDLVEGFGEVKNIDTDIKRVKWYRVPVNQLEDMYDMSNYNKYTILYYPMMSYHPYFKDYEHYIIGYKYDKDGRVKYLVYGIPGHKNKGHQPYGGKTGFVTWVPANYRDDKEFGYWLMFYDFRTSTIVVPAK
ncbi:hypothetical protein JMF89_01430 [Clostridiaceae bacterium UIB06]|uniref:DUF7922 domain-containing protein n=1 Tax=Clostridium thailandense TaxID=2794346 RepID=A0A949TSU0_9CLOT|nr:hypothetical protein [Clostridium thailandense]MBV7272711.1 hypothetical protein [Clostridium thailandense]MCH5135877.1 hypothetical protein [Clostridiaceae bacterium UIB06]